MLGTAPICLLNIPLSAEVGFPGSRRAPRIALRFVLLYHSNYIVPFIHRGMLLLPLGFPSVPCRYLKARCGRFPEHSRARQYVKTYWRFVPQVKLFYLPCLSPPQSGKYRAPEQVTIPWKAHPEAAFEHHSSAPGPQPAFAAHRRKASRLTAVCVHAAAGTA